MSETLAIKRVAFNDIKQKLYRKRDFGLSYPSSLCITFEGESIYFDSTGQAKAFYDQWIAGWISLDIKIKRGHRSRRIGDLIFTLFIFWNANPIIIFCWYGNCHRYYYCCVSESYSLYIHINMCSTSLWSIQFMHILVVGNCIPNHYFSMWCHKAILTQSFNVLGELLSKKSYISCSGHYLYLYSNGH